MDKKIAGLLGAAAALATVSGAHASTQPQSNQSAATTSYRDLLEPVPDALALLKADDTTHVQQPARVQLAQHHHHHHHHHGFFGGFIPPIVVAPGPTCYWTLGRPVWNGYRWVRPRVRVCN